MKSAEISIYSTVIGIYLIFSLYWVIIFIRRIHSYKIFQKSAYRNILDFNSGYINEQWYYHYETEIWKYIYLLTTNFTEVLGTIFYFIERIYIIYLESNPKLHLNNIQKNEKCGNVNNTYLVESYTIKSSIVFMNIIKSIGNIADIVLVSLLICLMNYLTMRIKRIETSPRTFSNTSILFMTCIVSVLILLLCSIHPLLLLGRTIFVLAFTVVFWNFFRTVKQFRLTLQMKSIQRLAQHGSNKVEMRENKYFKYTTNILCVGFFLIFVFRLLSNAMEMLVHILFFSDCIFIMNLSLNKHFQISNEALNIANVILSYLSMLERLESLFEALIFLVPFFLVTLHIWYKLIRKAIWSNSTDYRIKGHEFY